MTFKLLSAVALASLLAFAAEDDALPPHRDSVVLLAFRSNVPIGIQDAILTMAGAQIIKRLGARTLMVNVMNGKVAATIKALQAHGELLYSEPDYAFKTVEASRTSMLGAASMAGPRSGAMAQSANPLPNDPFVAMQWAVQNTGQTVNGVTGTPGADERLLPAWGLTTGTNSVVIAILDTGVQYSHPDLFNNVWVNPGGIGGCAAGTRGYNVITGLCDPMDDDTCFGGHGTHVAGIFGAIGNNGAGVAGVNWTTTILPVKWLKSDCSGYTSDLITSMDWVIQAKHGGVNVRVVNDSVTSPGTPFSQALSDEIDLLGTNDILFVTAAGNTGENNDAIPRYPCTYDRPNQLCVTASDEHDNLWASSNFGATTVQLAAPGLDIYSTERLSNYGFISGGSMSAAQVSGAAALILSRGYLTAADLRSRILANVDPIPSLTNLVATGGRLNICKAMPGCTTAVPSAPFNTVPPNVVGVPQFGTVLGAATGMWSGIPTTFSYQWYRCSSTGLNCSPIPGATGQTYGVLAKADTGATLAVTVTASNSLGSATAQSTSTGVVAAASPPFSISSTIVDGQRIAGTVNWHATPSHTANFVEFYVDGALSQTDLSSPYVYNEGSTNVFDSTTLANGTHVLGLRALSSDNRTYSFYGATVTVANPPKNIVLPAITGSAVQGQTLTASTGSWTNAPTSYSYRWNRCNTSGSSCAAISGATTSSYTATASDVGSTLRVAVTATNSAGSATISSSATATVAGTVKIATTSLPAGQTNHAYSGSVTASGGATPYSWSILSGSLPPGLALAPNTGAISGTPTATGTSNFTVQVRDANAQTAAKALSIAITTGGGGGIALAQSNSVEGSGLPSISAAFTASNTPGNLIVAFVRMSSTAQTVGVSDTAGNVYVDAVSQVQSSDGHQIHIFYAKNIVSGANTVTASFSSTNNHPWLAIYEYSGLSATNPVDRTAAAQGSGTSPSSGSTAATTSANELIFAGVGFPNSYGGTVTAAVGYTLGQQDLGTSRAANETELVSATGSYAATFSLTAAANWSAVVVTFAAASGPAPPAITTASLPAGQTNSPYSAPLAVSGGASPYTWSIASGALPTNLTLTPGTGVISGTPTVTGTSNFTVQVRDNNAQTATKVLSITITAAGTIALAQSNSVEGSGVASVSAGFPGVNTAGNLIVAFVRMSSFDQTVSVTDSAGNVYVDAVSQGQNADGHQVHILYARNIVGGANVVTARFSSTNNHPWLAIYEYSGLSTTSPLDQTAAAQGSDATPNSGPAATTASANELIFAGIGYPNSSGGTATPGRGYTLAQQDMGTSRATNETAVVTATGSYAATLALSTPTNWTAVLATFKP